MVTGQGGVWPVDLRPLTGSEPGCTRPVVVVQFDSMNRIRIPTVIRTALTTNLRWARVSGNSHESVRITGLPKDSVANVSQIVALDKRVLTARVGKLPGTKLDLLLSGIDTVRGRVPRLNR